MGAAGAGTTYAFVLQTVLASILGYCPVTFLGLLTSTASLIFRMDIHMTEDSQTRRLIVDKNSMEHHSIKRLNLPEGMESFTATDKAFKGRSSREKSAAALDMMMASDAIGIACVNHVPVNCTDDSVIFIPVLPRRGTQVGKTRKKRFWSRGKSRIPFLSWKKCLGENNPSQRQGRPCQIHWF